MTDKNRITRSTWVPLGAVSAGMVILSSAVWAVATDRAHARQERMANTTAIARHQTEIEKMADQITYLVRAMTRVETRLGTLPEGTD